MPCPLHPLSPPALLLGILAFLVPAGETHAHHLKAQAFLLPNKQVQIESWFSDGKIPGGAKVEVRNDRQELLNSGQLDDRGIFLFSYERPESLTVIVLAGAGHRAELTVTAPELEQSPQSSGKDGPPVSQTAGNSVNPVPIGVHDASVPVKDIVVGISFLLALGAFLLSVRNARRLKELESGG